jgi:hypothetical protein
MKYQTNNWVFLLLMSSFLGSCSSGLEIPTDPQIKMTQRGSLILPGSEGDVKIYIDDITLGFTEMTVRLVDQDSILLQQRMTSGTQAYFRYLDNKYYRINLLAFENHTFHDDLAFVSIKEVEESVGKANVQPVEIKTNTPITPEEIRAVFKKIETSDLTFIRNGDTIPDTTLAKHLEAKFMIHKKDIQSREDFIEKIISKSFLTEETYQVVENGDTLSLVDWISR